MCADSVGKTTTNPILGAQENAQVNAQENAQVNAQENTQVNAQENTQVNAQLDAHTPHKAHPPLIATFIIGLISKWYYFLCYLDFTA